MSDPIRRLYEAVLVARGEDPAESRTAKLFRDGRIKIAKKLVEEAAEVALESSVEDRDAVIRESVDLLYNLVVLWASNAIAPSEIWHEMADREEQLGMAEKLPKS